MFRPCCARVLPGPRNHATFPRSISAIRRRSGRRRSACRTIPAKSLVDKSGELLYHYGQGGREFGTARRRRGDRRRGLAETGTALAARAHRQDLLDRTGAWRSSKRRLLSPTCHSACQPAGPRNDLILVHVTNTGQEPRTFQPQLIVDTALGMRLRAAARRGQQPRNGHLFVEDDRAGRRQASASWKR